MTTMIEKDSHNLFTVQVLIYQDLQKTIKGFHNFGA